METTTTPNEDTPNRQDVELVSVDKANKLRLLQPVVDREREDQKDIEQLCLRFNAFQQGRYAGQSLIPKSHSLEKALLQFLVSPPPAGQTNPRRETQVSSYIAVSYCWRPGRRRWGEKRRKEWTQIRNDEIQKPWPFPKVLANAILGLRTSPEEGIWLDQECINQNNEEEKTHVIGIMDMIYHNARRLVVLLEDVRLTAEEVALVKEYQDYVLDVKKMEETPVEEWKATDEQKNLMYLFAEKLLKAEWFDRAWCFHEFQVARLAAWHPDTQPLFIAYDQKGNAFTIPSILLMVFWNLACNSKIGRSKTANIARFSDLFRASKAQVTTQKIAEIWSGKTHMQQIEALVALGCTWKKDLVQIGLNLTAIPATWSGSIKIQPESTLARANAAARAYVKDKSPEILANHEVAWASTVLALSIGDVSPLAFSGSPLNLDFGRQGTCSWAQRPEGSGELARVVMVPPEEVRVHSMSPEAIELDLIILSHPAQMPMQSQREQAYHIINDEKTDLFTRELVYPTAQGKVQLENWIASLHWETKKCLRFPGPRILAAAIDCGLPWIEASWPVMYESFRRTNSNSEGTPAQDLFHNGDYYGTDDGRRLQLATDWLLEALQKRHGSMAISENAKSCCFNFLALITDPRCLGYCSDLCMSVRLNASSGHGALTDWVDPKYTLAVPACMAGEPFTPFSRLWVLEEMKPGNGEWRLVGKQKIVGCRDIRPDGSTSRLAMKQKVFGKLQDVPVMPLWKYALKFVKGWFKFWLAWLKDDIR